ncbi:MAG: cyclic nucleotide-binding and patatin-like phospholipase domain-containing protein [Solirubrobacterales bacterium]
MEDDKDPVAAILAQSPLFGSLPDEARRSILDRLESVRIDAGDFLMRKGDPGDALYLVETGRLEVVRGDLSDSTSDNEEAIEILRVLGPGATVGELALVTGDTRSASVRASRDSSLLRLSFDDFRDLTTNVPSFTRALLSVMGRQLQASGGLPEDLPQDRTFAIVPLFDDMDVVLIAEGVRSAFAGLGGVIVLDPSTAETGDPVAWGRLLDESERRHERVMLVTDRSEGEWRRFCVRQADRLVCVAPPRMPPAGKAMPRLKGCDLVLGGAEHPAEVAQAWISVLEPRARHRIRAGAAQEADLARVARRLTGRSLGLVLGGGGARGFAHLGLLDVLEENGIVIDRIGGTSMGGVVSSAFAAGLDPPSRRRALKAAFSGRVRHRYQLMPKSALTQTKGAEEVLDRVFGDRFIETLPVDLFTIAADMVRAEMVVQRSGRVAEAALHTVRIPAFLPPGRSKGQLLVDGGLIRNLPVDVMAEMDEGPVVAVEVGGGFNPGVDDDGQSILPAMGETLMRSVMLGSAASGDAVTERADLIIEPEVSELKMLAFGDMDRAVEIGRKAGEAALDQVKDLLNRHP